MTFLVDHPIAFDREIIVSPFSLTKRRRRVLTGASLKVSAHMKKILRQLRRCLGKNQLTHAYFTTKATRGENFFLSTYSSVWRQLFGQLLCSRHKFRQDQKLDTIQSNAYINFTLQYTILHYGGFTGNLNLCLNLLLYIWINAFQNWLFSKPSFSCSEIWKSHDLIQDLSL